MKIEVLRSPDSRLRTGSYSTAEGECFSLAEKTASGTLVTEFKATGEIVNQVFDNGKNPTEALSRYLGVTTELEVRETDIYQHVKVNAKCAKCGSNSLERALDKQEIGKARDVPVVPIFVCGSCGSKHYAMSDAYLKRLIARKESLFETDELGEKGKDEGKFVETLQAYIIRIFASKKIHKLAIRG